ncbi:MAG: glycosyltransferase family 4 protein [Cuniculiplasma sp.]
MRVALFMTTDPEMGGGVERWVINTIKGKPNESNLVLVKTDYSDKKRFNFRERENKGITFVTLNLWENKFNFLRKSRVLSFWLDNFLLPLMISIFKRKYLSEIKKDLFDVVYLTKNQYWKLFKGKKIVGSNHTEFGDEGFISTLKAKLFTSGLIYRDVSYFHVFPGRKKIEAILSRRAKILVLPNGTIDRKCPDKEDKDISFLYVGRLENIKGIDILLNAWKDVEPSNGKLMIVGGGSFNVDPFKDVKGIEFKGIVSDNDLDSIYCKSDVFIYPTRWDSFPMTVIEAMSSGCFIITSNRLASAFRRDETMNFIEYIPPEEAAVKNAIRHVIEHVDEVRIKSIKSYEFFKSNYELNAINRKFFEFLEEI